MTSMFQNFLSFKLYFTWRNNTVYRGQRNVEFEYLSEFVTEYENNLGYEFFIVYFLTQQYRLFSNYSASLQMDMC